MHGKSAPGLVAAKARLIPDLPTLPQWAYLLLRGTRDALLQVTAHCRRVRSHAPIPEVVGDFKKLVDLSRAFDTLPRTRLLSGLQKLRVPSELIQLLTQWHPGTSCIVETGSATTQAPNWLGSRQGCCSAPFLWAAAMWGFLRALADRTTPEWVSEEG